MTDEASILDELTNLPASENYTPKDKYRDFRLVFTTEEGKRALREIVSWAKLLRAPVLKSPIDPYILAIREGQQSIVRKLLITIYSEPPERPTKSSKRG